MKYSNALFYKEVKVNIYEQDGTYYMTADDLGRCVGFSEKNAGILMNNYVSRKKWFDPNWTIKCTLPSKQGMTRLYSERGIIAICNMRSNDHLKTWANAVFKNLRSGIYGEPEPPEKPAKDKVPSNPLDAASDLELMKNEAPQFLINCSRATAIATIACATADTWERKRLASAAMKLLLTNDFNKVRKEFLLDYENLS